ncbi:hypothetical protein ACVV62_02935 [Streptococcus pluranimalium]
MKKICIFLSSIFMLLGTGLLLTQYSVLAESPTNAEIAKNILIENGYSASDAEQDLAAMTIQDEGELIGIDIHSKSESNISFFRAARPKTTHYLSHSAVRQIYSNFNAIDKGSYILGTLVGFYNPVYGAVIGAGGFQNPNLRNAITKAYHQGKRVKIVTEYGASMSLNKTYYYVVN